jgi:hypothetical protein
MSPCLCACVASAGRAGHAQLPLTPREGEALLCLPRIAPLRWRQRRVPIALGRVRRGACEGARFTGRAAKQRAHPAIALGPQSEKMPANQLIWGRHRHRHRDQATEQASQVLAPNAARAQQYHLRFLSRMDTT